MAPNIVLVTGVADQLGGSLADRLAADPSIDRVLGVDTRPPAAGASARGEHVSLGIRDPRVGPGIDTARGDTRGHAAPPAGGGPPRAPVQGRQGNRTHPP